MKIRFPLKKSPFKASLKTKSLSLNEGSISIAKRLKNSAFWTIALPVPKSQRFSQLSFEGFRPRGRNRIEQHFNVLIEFVTFVFKYSKRKVRNTILSVRKSFVALIIYISSTKALVVRKLIWSGGRLGRPVTTMFVVFAAFLVFMFGEVLSSSRYVNSQEISPDYVLTVTDIIPQTDVAVTTIPESRKKSEPFSYFVESGDSLSSIGNKFKISVDAVKYVNNLNDNSVLKVGQELVIPPVTGLIHKVQRGDTLNSLAKKYDVPPQAIADFNYILDTSSLAIGSELVIPDAKVPKPVFVPTTPTAVVTAPGSVTDPSPSSGWCMWPTSARIITQYFSWYHNGLDIAVSGSVMPPLYACGEGVVKRAGWDPFGLGLHVTIDHGNGYETVYGHMSSVNVSYGQSVGKGEVIGYMGSTGRSTGPHVHFIIKFKGVSQNPLNYIQ